jgi:SRSO17 transposase
LFKTKTRTSALQSQLYISGLFQAEKTKRNMERMTEKVHNSEYYQMQHFISESPWDAEAVKQDVAGDVHAAFKSAALVGFMLDESGTEKKGKESVGVAHQYCGNKGKVCNSQVAVYGCLVEGIYGALVDARLYLPKEWTNDAARCKKAGIPEGCRQYKKKTDLALEMVRAQRKAGIRMDFVGADAFYGNDGELLEALDSDGELFVIDIHSNRQVYSRRPVIAVPPANPELAGRPPKNYQSDIDGSSVEAYMQGLTGNQWEKVQVRKGTKGIINAQVHIKEVFTWDDKKEVRTHRWLLVIMKITGKDGETEYRYAFSNAGNEQFAGQQLAHMMAQRFWIEYCFREMKQEIGMADYQIRGWLAWHHHIVLCMMAQYFILTQKLLLKEDVPLLSAYDIRMILIKQLMDKQKTDADLIDQLAIRHQQRQRDINRYYSKNSS